MSSHMVAIYSALAACLGSLMFGISLAFTGPCIDTMKNAANMPLPADDSLVIFSAGEATTFGSLLTVGALGGSLFAGTVMNVLGPRGGLLVASPLYVGSYVWIALGSAVWEFFVARVMGGIALGFCSVLVSCYVGEISPVHLRGGLGAAAQLNIALGLLTSYVFGLIFKTDRGIPGGDFSSWRAMSWACAVPAALLGVLMLFAPESPRWLARKGRNAQAIASLRKLRGGDCGEEESGLEAPPSDGPSGMTLRDMKDSSRQLLLGVVMHFCLQASGLNAVTFYQTSFLKQANVGNPDLISVITMAINVVGSIFAVFLMDKMGRRPLFLIALTGVGISCFLYALVFAVPSLGAGMAITAAFAFFAFFSIGLGSIPYLLLVELYPPKVLSFFMSFTVAVGWTTSFFVTKFTDVWAEATSKQAVFIGYGVVCILGSVFAFFRLPETKGKSLEEVQSFFRSTTKVVELKPVGPEIA